MGGVRFETAPEMIFGPNQIARALTQNAEPQMCEKVVCVDFNRLL